MNTSWIKARQTKYGLYITVYILVVIAVVVGANWLANANNSTYDTTANKRFTLSDATKQTLSGLKNDLTISYFDRPAGIENARATLGRYKDASSKIKLKMIDSEKEPELAAQGIHAGSVLIQYGSKREEPKSLSETEITTAIKRAMTGSVRTACFITGSGEASIADTQNAEGMAYFKSLMEDNAIKTKELSMPTKMDDACTIVVIAGPSVDYAQPQVDMVKKFVEDGGKALIMFAPSIVTKTGGGKGEPALEKMAADWGVTVDNVLLYDERQPVRGKTFLLAGNYGTHAVVKDMGRYATLFPLSRSLNVTAGKGLEKLLDSSDTTHQFDGLKPPFEDHPDKDKKGPFALAAAGTAGKGRVVITGSSEWVSNRVLGSQLGPNNAALALNMVNWLTADESLMTIPAREPEDRRIMLTGRQLTMVAISSVIFLPLMVIVSGFVVWWKRR